MVLAGLATVTVSQIYKKIDEMKIQRELIIWDYVQKHPQDFPEVFYCIYNFFLSFKTNIIYLQKPEIMIFSD